MTVHLLCGPSGAGKTSQARKLALESKSIPLLIDECLRPLCIPEYPDPAYAQMVLQKAEQCVCRILKRAEQFLAENKNVVLDIATFRRQDRDYVRAWALRQNFSVVLYYVYASKATRWARIEKRNAEKGDTYSFNVPLWWFETAERVFEPPSNDEVAVFINNDEA